MVMVVSNGAKCFGGLVGVDEECKSGEDVPVDCDCIAVGTEAAEALGYR